MAEDKCIEVGSMPAAHTDSERYLGDFPQKSNTILQPQTRRVSQDQLIAEVKGIYAGLVMVESKCIEVDDTQAPHMDSGTGLSNEQWHALIALHRTLLHEHHDFFSASQNASASQALRRLASKYPMPARMWRHGIHSFFEFLRLNPALWRFRLGSIQWQALIALRRTLLHEHHDFFPACEHPSACQAFRRLASKHLMPARMWRHGIHSFLELLRRKLPTTLKHMLTFIYLAYSLVVDLYGTTPTFEETWIECLGDLGRYPMAIDDEDYRDRDIWTSVSQPWYNMASDRAPITGRQYHVVTTLARPNAPQQLYYYAKSLCVPMPFVSTRESITDLFDPSPRDREPWHFNSNAQSGPRFANFRPSHIDSPDQLGPQTAADYGTGTDASAHSQSNIKQKPWVSRNIKAAFSSRVARAIAVAMFPFGVAGTDAENDAKKEDAGRSAWDLVDLFVPPILLATVFAWVVFSAMWYHSPRKFYGVGMGMFAFAYVVIGENDRASPLTTLV